MSPEDLETVRRAYDAFARGDLETLTTFLAPDIEWRTTPEVPFMGNYSGLDEFLGGMGEWTGAFDGITTEVEEMIDAGENVIVGRGSAPGGSVRRAANDRKGATSARARRIHPRRPLLD